MRLLSVALLSITGCGLFLDEASPGGALCLTEPEGLFASSRFCFGGAQSLETDFVSVGSEVLELSFDREVSLGADYIELRQANRGVAAAGDLFASLALGQSLTVELVLSTGGLAPSQANSPHRIVALETVEADATTENLLIGATGPDCNRTGSLIVVRSESDGQGCLTTGFAISGLPQHLAVTLGGGAVSVYGDGSVNARAPEPNNFEPPSAWNPQDAFVTVGNQVDGDREWFGRVHFFAIYDRELEAAEIAERAQKVRAAVSADP